MNKTTYPLWIAPTKLPDGHRLFQAAQPLAPAIKLSLPHSIKLPKNGGVWSIADNSGDYPQDTDCGILWLDFSRDLRAGAPNTGRDDSAPPGIPLVDEHGEECSTITDTCTLLVLSVKFGWPINVLGTPMAVREI